MYCHCIQVWPADGFTVSQKKERLLDRAQKENQVASLNNIFVGAGVVIVTRNTGLSVVEITDLRRKMRAAGGQFRVAKNRLVKLALAGTLYEPVTDLFSGPTAIAYSDDVVTAPKVVSDFAKQNEKLVVVGGAMGEVRLDEAGVNALASLPSLDELRATLLAMINTPATRVAGVLQAPGIQVARVLSAYGSADEAA